MDETTKAALQFAGVVANILNKNKCLLTIDHTYDETMGFKLSVLRKYGKLSDLKKQLEEIMASGLVDQETIAYILSEMHITSLESLLSPYTLLHELSTLGTIIDTGTATALIEKVKAIVLAAESLGITKHLLKDFIGPFSATLRHKEIAKSLVGMLSLLPTDASGALDSISNDAILKLFTAVLANTAK